MNGSLINFDLIKKINSFFKKSSSLRFLDPYIFDNIDKYKETSNCSFNDYYLEYIKSLPRLNFDSVVKISREVYKLYGKEKEFDEILEKLRNSYSINVGSLNEADDNCIIKASENRVLLSGTYYDVILLCHEIGHKLRFDKSVNTSDLMDSFLFETPSIIFEFAANSYLRDNYGVDIKADELRKVHVLSTLRENSIEKSIFQIIMNLLKEKKLNAINLYKEFIKNSDIVLSLTKEEISIEDCVDEAISSYSYDVGYILSNYINNSDNRIPFLDMILKYKDKGIDALFIIDEEIIKSAFGYQKNMKY